MNNEMIAKVVARLVSYPQTPDEEAVREMVKKLLIPNDIKNYENYSEHDAYKCILWHLNTHDEIYEKMKWNE